MTVVRERMTRGDARHSGIRVEYMFGPIRMPSREDFVAALTTIARNSPLLRIGADLSADHRSRVRDQEHLHEWAERVVEVVPGDGFTHFVDGFRDRSLAPLTTETMHFTLYDRHVLFAGDHSLGDSGILMRMAPAVIAVANGEPIPPWLMRPEPRHALRRALWNTFGRHPRQVRAALAVHGPDPEETSAVEMRPWQLDPAIASVTISNERFRALRQAYRPLSSKVPSTIALLALARAALEAESIEVSALSWVPIDARRYLPDGVDLVGNFAPQVAVSTVGSMSAVALSDQLATSLESGRPLLAMTLSSLRSAHTPEAPVSVPIRPRADVSVTTVGLRQEVDGLPWLDRTDSWFNAATTPGHDPLAIRFAIAPTRGGATITVTYHASVFPREQVESALHRLSAGDVAELVTRYAAKTA